MGDLPREFRITGGFGRVVWSYKSILVALFVIFGVVSVDAVGWWGAVAAGGAVDGLFVGKLFSNFRRMQANTVAAFSEQGVEWRDKIGLRVRLRWPDVTRIDEVEFRQSPPHEDRRGMIRMKSNDGVIKLQGLVGWGERIMPLDVPGWVLERLAAEPRNPADGRPGVIIPLGLIDPDWQRTDMGELVRRHRPDLFDDDAT